jgi:hypothetical protein
MAMIVTGARYDLARAITGNGTLTFDQSGTVELWISVSGTGLPFSQVLEPTAWQIAYSGNAIYTAEIIFGVASSSGLVGTGIRLSYNGIDWLDGQLPQEYTVNAGDTFAIQANTLVIEW